MDVTKDAWYPRWIAACAAALENVFSWKAEYVICVGIQADTGKNPATEDEWPALQKHIQQGFKEKRIKGPADSWQKMEFRLIPVGRLARLLKEADGDTYVIIMSCPGQHFAEVTEKCDGNRNVLKSWGQVDDLANNLDGVHIASSTIAASGHATRPTAIPPQELRPPAGAVFKVENCELDDSRLEINGYYRVRGTFNGRPVYTNDHRAAIFRTYTGGGFWKTYQWCIGPDSEPWNAHWVRNNDGNAERPPPSGWELCGGGHCKVRISYV